MTRDDAPVQEPVEPSTPEEAFTRRMQQIVDALNAGESITRDDAIFVVRAVGRHCRGPYRTIAQVLELHPSQRRPILEALTLSRAQLSGVEITVTEAEMEDPRVIIATLLAEGQHDLANQLDTVLRAACGYDVNELVIEGGFDGEEHEELCPWCGTILRWRAPWFPNVTEA